jgi:TPR repeat protein
VRRSSIPAIAATLACWALLAGCNAKEKGMSDLPEISANIKNQLAFTCTHEADRIPARDPEADQLYKHARWLVRKNILKKDPAAYPPIERLLRIATAHGHDKANIELRHMLDAGQAVSPDPVNESIDLVHELVRRGIPSGYYDMGWYLEHGYGMRVDRDLAFKYFRKSADMGNPEGQFVVGQMLSDMSKWGAEIAAIGNAMRRCAADQGHAEAGQRFATYLQDVGQHADAMKYFQIGASAGNATAALSLSDAFSIKNHADPTWGLGQDADRERQSRYEAMQKFLSDYSYLNPTIPEIDEIAPLPPARLASWDGKFRWLEEYRADRAPPLPGADRIAEMARAKGLDPRTGRPTIAAR